MADNKNNQEDDDSIVSKLYMVHREEMNRLIQVDFQGDQELFDHWRIMIENGTLSGDGYDPDIFAELPPIDWDRTPTDEEYARTLLDQEIDGMKFRIQWAKEDPKKADIEDIIEVAEFFEATLMQHMKELDEMKEKYE